MDLNASDLFQTLLPSSDTMQGASSFNANTSIGLTNSTSTSMLNSNHSTYELSPSPGSNLGRSHSLMQLIIVAIASTLVSIAIIACNCLVFLSFKINKKLHTVSNYFILSLAASDLLVGMFSTNLYTMYLLLDYWPLGNFVCDIWLSVDYVCRQASVFNLVVICVDRYMNLKRPFLHKVNRTAFKARIAISIVWITSLLIWAPLIVSYQYMIGTRTVSTSKCYVQFLSDSIPITMITGLLTFYVPVAIMISLYFKIYRLTTDRIRDFALMTLQFHIGSTVDFLSEERRRSKLKRGSLDDQSLLRKKSIDLKIVRRAQLDKFSAADTDDDSVKDAERLSNASTKLAPKRKYAMVFRRGSSGENLWSRRRTSTMSSSDSPRVPKFLRKKSSSFDYSGLQIQQPNGLLGKLRSDSDAAKDMDASTPKVRKKSCSVDFTGMRVIYQKDNGKKRCYALSERTRSDSLFSRRDTLFSRRNTILKRRGSVGKHRKAAKMVVLLLLAFTSTWIMYNVLALIKPFCSKCIPSYLWNVSNWLCYLNSLVNPFCYAFGNREFRKSFRTLVGLGRKKLHKKFKF